MKLSRIEVIVLGMMASFVCLALSVAGAFAVYMVSLPSNAQPALVVSQNVPTVAMTKLSQPTAIEIATATIQSSASCMANAMQRADVAWDIDWPKAIDALTQARACDQSNQTVVDKLYSAYYNYAQKLLAQGNKVEAARQFSNALNIKPTGNEAQQALLSLSPTATPRPTNTPAPAPTKAFASVTKRVGPMHDALRDQDHSMEVTVKDIRWYAGDDYERPKTGNVYVIVSVNVRNLGPGTAYSVYTTDFQMKDGNGAIHNDTYIVSASRDCNLELVDLSSGGNISGCIGFEVPLGGSLEFIFAPFQYEALTPGRYLSFLIR